MSNGLPSAKKEDIDRAAEIVLSTLEWQRQKSIPWLEPVFEALALEFAKIRRELPKLTALKFEIPKKSKFCYCSSIENRSRNRCCGYCRNKSGEKALRCLCNCDCFSLVKNNEDLCVPCLQANQRDPFGKHQFFLYPGFNNCLIHWREILNKMLKYQRSPSAIRLSLKTGNPILPGDSDASIYCTPFPGQTIYDDIEMRKK